MSITKQIITQAEKVIIGKENVIKNSIAAMFAGGHILFEDVPGVGKTTLSLAISKIFGQDFKRIQFTPDTMPSDILGFSYFDKQSEKLKFQQGAIMTNILLADEINRTSPKTQAALLEAMEEKQISVDGNTYKLPTPFTVIATQNPTGSAGTQVLPNSQLDRFMIRLKMGYPDFKQQIEILKSKNTDNSIENIERVVDEKTFFSLQEKVEKVFISDEVYEYITKLVEKTRNCDEIELGVSPRGAIAVCAMAKATAFSNERDFVIPSDVKDIFEITCAHRIILNKQAKLSGTTDTKIINKVLEQTEMPKI